MTCLYRIDWPERLADANKVLYSVSATFPQATTDSELRQMLQRLLEDRFGLRTRWVKKTFPAYDVKVAPGAFKLLRSKYDPGEDRDPRDPNDQAQREERNRYSILQVREGWRISGVITIAQLLGTLGTEIGTLMVDKTGMAGFYDINFAWNRPYVPPIPPSMARNTAEAAIPEGSKTATLFPALEKQLGLKAEASTLEVEVLTIESIERAPTEN